MDQIIIKGARENNLKNIDIALPKNKLIVMTGLSGSGKSSLAFDTIFAEGQRRYVESLSSYARQFLGGFEKPLVDSIEGLSPAISIDQKTTSHNPRSTVGTVTEIYDYIRLLYAKIGIPYCPTHHIAISKTSIEEVVNIVSSFETGEKIMVLSTKKIDKENSLGDLIESIQKDGLNKIEIDQEIISLDEEYDLLSLEKKAKKQGYCYVIIDRLIVKDGIRSRLFESLELASKMDQGKMVIEKLKTREHFVYTENYCCPYCDFTIRNLEPRLFSFNSPLGACPECHGLGVKENVSPSLVIDETKSIEEGCVLPYKNADEDNLYFQTLNQTAKFFNIPTQIPFGELNEEQRNIMLYGSPVPVHFNMKSSNGHVHDKIDYFEGIISGLQRRYEETTSEWIKEWLSKYIVVSTCPRCNGNRLSDAVLSILVGNKNIAELCNDSIENIYSFFEELKLSDKEYKISELILTELKSRLGFLKNVGLEYLTLSRRAETLSGGESQRIRLATQIGSQLTGVLYVLDEPSIGLHQKDNERLIQTLKKMRDLGNTLIVVEHDEDTMREADYLVDVGPGAGIHGGRIVAAGTPEEVMKNPNSLTGKYLTGEKFIPIPTTHHEGTGEVLSIIEASENNLKNISVDIPLGKLTLVTGVSGSGKSSLVNDVIYTNIYNAITSGYPVKAGKVKAIKGIEKIDRIIDVSQDPIGKTPRSNPATYTGLFDDIRDLFCQTNEAKVRGYGKGRFSFNVKGGRCEACCGDGVKKISMHFLPDVYVPCEVCKGKRYNSETLEIKYKDKNIADCLDMTVEDALAFFENVPKVKNRLQTIYDVGLGYIKLGQSATTLSGGEAQRVKLASELYRRVNSKTLIILDEPTTGLHTDDVGKLIQVVHNIVNKGATVIVIEHNLDFIKQADYIIDLGPNGGDKGGTIVSKGSLEDIMNCTSSYTGEFLRKIIKK